MDEKVKMENLTHEDRMKLFETTELYGLKILHMFYKKLAYNEDLQQEMRIARWQAALEYDPSRGINFTAFAKKRILERVSAECYRMRRQRKIQLTMIRKSKVDFPKSEVEDDYSAFEFLDFVEHLPWPANEILFLKHEGYKQIEIAKMLDLPEYQVSRELKRALKKHAECEIA